MLNSYDFSLQNIPEIEIIIFLLPKVGVALLVGTIIGFEREYRGKLAGIKTNALICAASAIFTALSIIMSKNTASSPSTSPDVTRIIAQIVSGIGFIGAGAIFKSSSKVQGLTTAAVIWTVSALGILVGYGIFMASIIITLGLVGFLSIVSNFEKRFFKHRSPNQDSNNTTGGGTMD